MKSQPYSNISGDNGKVTSVVRGRRRRKGMSEGEEREKPAGAWSQDKRKRKRDTNDIQPHEQSNRS